jgi:uncharacterized protein (DUF302 family)
VAPEQESYTARRLTVEIPGVREFQRRYEEAVPLNPVHEIADLVERDANWADVIACIAERALYGFLIYWRADFHPLMRLAGDRNDCVAYLMGNVAIAERMFRHDAQAMLYAPLRTVIWEDGAGCAWFTIDQPSTLFDGFGVPDVSAVGIELDRKLAVLLEALGAEVPMALFASGD